MPYFIYSIDEFKNLKPLSEQATYKDAKAQVILLRKDLGPEADIASIRMVFANSTAEAERLLSIPRDNRVIGED
ncbi:hypothetical protein TI04_04455 [Achromatium sp. WMS2]|nr:hypothetical protein TI04_04455 [Achromatium sp. WMS2]